MNVRLAVALLVSFLTSCSSDARKNVPQPTRPNVLFIAVDDLNDWIGALGGHPQAATPNIDRLAEQGVLFTRAYCSAPACNPSRAAMMTGIRPSNSGIYHNSNPWREAMPNAVTLPQHFMTHGYTAMGAGKIFHGRFPDPPSWDVYYPSKTQTKPKDPEPPGRPLNGIPKTAHFDWGPVEVLDSAMGDAKVADWVIEQLGKEYDQPFFLACGIYRPHLPWYVPSEYFDAFPVDQIELPKTIENDLDDIPPLGVRRANPGRDHKNVRDYQQWHRAVQGYLASIAFADRQIGRVLDALDRSPHVGNTIVVLWTDHGWNLGEKQHWRKFALWEDTTRTPLIFVAPGVTEAGARCDRPVNLIDVYPTLLDLCNLTTRAELDGRSLKPLLVDPTAAWEPPSLTTHGRNNHALRTERFRYIRYEDGTEELYDHESDPHEWHNLARDPQSDTVKEQIARWLPSRNVEEVRAER